MPFFFSSCIWFTMTIFFNNSRIPFLIDSYRLRIINNFKIHFGLCLSVVSKTLSETNMTDVKWQKVDIETGIGGGWDFFTAIYELPFRWFIRNRGQTLCIIRATASSQLKAGLPDQTSFSRRRCRMSNSQSSSDIASWMAFSRLVFIFRPLKHHIRSIAVS